MKTKDIIITLILSITIVILYIVNEYTKVELEYADTAYQVYLNGEVIGLIEDDASLYNLINNEQQAIKNEYNVDYVYPPNVFEIVETKTYDNDFSSPENIYKLIEERDDFTVQGYTITIRYDEDDYYEDEEVPQDFSINVLDVDVFNEAIKKYILAFVSEDDYNNFMNNTVEELTDIGQIITNMYFQEKIMIKEAYISVNDTIYTDADKLAQDLLFGVDAKMDTYTVQAGDSIDSISAEFELNPQEFLIANPNYRSEDVMLSIGSKVNVTLLNPIVTFIYKVEKIEESITPFSKQTVPDSTKEYGFKEVTQAGITGLSLNHETYEVKNGEQSSEIDIISTEVVRSVVDEITTVGPSYSGVSGSYEEIPGKWGWPTNRPSVITSPYSYRCLRGVCKTHEGIDISGTGRWSPIYAIADGTVVNVSPACSSCHQWSNGNYVVIKHDNNYYSAYLHLQDFNVKEGQTVEKGDVIAYMGDSGYATGVHLHLGLYEGEPFAGGYTRSINPLTTIYSGI